MAQKVQVTKCCDISGDEGAGVATCEFGWEGSTYEIELNEMYGAALLILFTEGLIPHARKVPRGVGQRREVKPQAPRSPEERARSQKIREWAWSQGIPCGNHGRIPGDIIRQYGEYEETRQRMPG